MMQLILTYITRAYAPNIKDTTVSNENLNDQRFLLIANEFIYNSQYVTLLSLAKKIGFCERQVQRLIYKYYGKSFLEKSGSTNAT